MQRRLTAAILRSPLHGLVTRHKVGISVGEDVAVLPFSREGDSLTVLGTEGEDWWRSLEREGTTPVEVDLQGSRRRGVARFVGGEELDQALLPYLHQHPGAWKELAVPPNASAEAVADAAQQVAVIVIDLMP